MKKAKIISLIMALATLFSVAMPVYAVEAPAYDYSVMPISEDDIMLISPNPMAKPDTITVVLNGETIDFTDDAGNKVDPQLINNRTMVPVRKIFEVLGATIEWDGATETVTAKTEEKTMKLQINNNIATVTTGEETEELTLDSAPVVIDGRTLVPVRFISETLGLKVGWDDPTQTVIIMDTGIILEIIKKEAPTFYAMLTEETVAVKTAEMDFDIEGTLKYTHTEDSSNNSNIKFALNSLLKIAEKAIGMDVDYKVTGKGAIYDMMKESGVEAADMNVIVDLENPALYVKSSLIESEIGNKWAKEAYEDVDEIADLSALEQMQAEMAPEERLQAAIDSMFDLMTLTPTTYQETEMITTLICMFVNDDYLTVSGRTTKTYKYEISVKDIEEILSSLGLGELGLSEMLKDTKLTFTAKYEGGINTEATFKLAFDMDYDDEVIDLDLTMIGKMNKINENVLVKIPAEKDVILINEITE